MDMEKLGMTQQQPALPGTAPQRQRRTRRRGRLALLGLTTFVLLALQARTAFNGSERKVVSVPMHAEEALAKCHNLHIKPAPPPDFNFRKESERFAEGTPAVLIRNATIWTGRVDGLEILKGDVLLDRGLIKAVGNIHRSLLDELTDLVEYDAHGAWVTPGIVDMHSHLGVYSAPALSGASDGNSLHGPILPWLRSLDGLNTHDDAYRLSISGGITTALVLPGSANSIGGQAFPIKLRPTQARSATSMLLEPPHTINGSAVPAGAPPRWRHMKHACGENPSRVYRETRMDNIWAMRAGYEKARQIKQKQDDYCEAAVRGQWEGLGDFPEDLQWESMVDILRGKVKVHNHCYETVDLNSMILMTQEFGFPIAAFHHSHETYLVAEQLKTAYGGAPASAMFATHARYKRESYRGSEFAPKILNEAGIRVVMKSDHPVLNSRHLIFEAQQAHYYGLPEEVAMSSVTSTPATVMGLEHRVGYIKRGYDADIVVWDSHPLNLGATPKQVFIDGIAQLSDPHVTPKPATFQKAPETPNWDEEAGDALKYEGLPPLVPKKRIRATVMFTNVSSLYRKDEANTVQERVFAQGAEPGVVVVSEGKIACSGSSATCASALVGHEDVELVDLKGGSIAPGFTSFGSALGLEEIQGEISTQDGTPFDPLLQVVPEIIGGVYSLDRAADGLMYGTRNALLAYLRGGVTTGIVAPRGRGFLSGIGAAFSTSAMHKLEKGALLGDDVALHVRLSAASPASVSTQIAALRRLLLTEEPKGELDAAFRSVARGERVLAVSVTSADIMSSLLRLKAEVEAASGKKVRMTFVGGQEAHLLAKEIGDANVGVILSPFRPFPGTWEQRRILEGPPLTKKGSVVTLMEAGITVGLGSVDGSLARNTRLDVGWAAIEAGHEISKHEALALGSSNIEKLLGAKPSFDLVATIGGDLLDMSAKVAGIISVERGVVDLI